ncbi:hypothetical protein A6035_12930 [Dietzia lutea]|uniref:Uncharacterized protein n=1 Tax=Dietzia lutea TaxID=546160 RepID=A0A2S1R9J5_9ACTN|nr:hypothetical protein A6035_12930 [Dietzia lutea]
MVSTYMGDLGEAVRDGESGLLVPLPPGDLAALARALERLLVKSGIPVYTADADTMRHRGFWERITAEVGAVPRHFAYPNGGPSDLLDPDVAAVADAGFVSAVTTSEGIHYADSDRFRLLRFNVHEERFCAQTGFVSHGAGPAREHNRRSPHTAIEKRLLGRNQPVRLAFRADEYRVAAPV